MTGETRAKLAGTPSLKCIARHGPRARSGEVHFGDGGWRSLNRSLWNGGCRKREDGLAVEARNSGREGLGRRGKGAENSHQSARFCHLYHDGTWTPRPNGAGDRRRYELGEARGELWWLLGGAELIRPPTCPIAARRVGDGAQIPSALVPSSVLLAAVLRLHFTFPFPLSQSSSSSTIASTTNPSSMPLASLLAPSTLSES
jgi:hypothetical protein